MLYNVGAQICLLMNNGKDNLAIINFLLDVPPSLIVCLGNENN